MTIIFLPVDDALSRSDLGRDRGRKIYHLIPVISPHLLPPDLLANYQELANLPGWHGMRSQPELPLPAHPELLSMLSRKFGKEVANYFSGSPLNRLSFLRSDHTFLSQAVTHPSTSFLLLRNLDPLTTSPESLAYLRYPEVEPAIGNPFKQPEDDQIRDFDSGAPAKPLALFLGIDESSPPAESFTYKRYTGAPFFALGIPESSSTPAISTLLAALDSRSLTFKKARIELSLPAPQAALYAQARSNLDWNARNPFCAGCGHRTLSIHAGYKRVCPPTDAALSRGTSEGSSTARPDCPTWHGLTNLSFPRTDATVIMAIVSSDGSKILLGRQKRWPPHWFSCLAGFIEPGESIEDAVRREVWEESGVRVGRVVMHSTQPWPYPSNLMVGAIAQCVPGGDGIDLTDQELERAAWYEVGEVREALRTGVSGLGDPPPEGYKEGGLRIPPRTAIANQLIQAVCDGFLEVTGKL